MLRLLIKDIKVARYYWLPALFIYVFFISTFVQFNLLYLLVNMALAFKLVLTVPLLEDRNGLAPFLCSLPIKRSQAVGARYLGSALILLAFLIVLESAAPLTAAVFEIEGARTDVLLSPAGALSFLLPLTFLLSLFLPLYFRLGLGRALWALAASCLCLFALFAAAVRLTARLAHKPLSEIFPVDGEIAVIPFKPFLPLASSLRDALGTPGLWALLLVVTGGMVALSLHLSIRFYRKREL